MASPGSFIRSAARATSSAYRRLPIRWRLAGGSALLTLVILLGFAAIVGVLTTRQHPLDFEREVAAAADELRKPSRRCSCATPSGQNFDVKLGKDSPDLDDYAASQDAVIRVVFVDGTLDRDHRERPVPAAAAAATEDFGGFRIESRPIQLGSRRCLRPVRAQAVRRQGDREPRARVPRPRRARRRRAGAAGRPGHRDARDGADHAADRHRARDRAHARPVADHPAPRVRATRSPSSR